MRGISSAQPRDDAALSLTLARFYDIFRSMKKHMLKGIALGLLIAISSASLNAQTEPSPTDPTEPSLGQEVGYGVGAALANVIYIPAKVTYAGLGLLTGGLGFVLSGGQADVANNIIYPSIRGTYVVTPNHLKGKEPIYFVGAPPAESGPHVGAAPPPDTATR
jgi:hypothetical protein